MKSWDILTDWWEGQYEAPGLSEAAGAYIRLKAAHPASTSEQPGRSEPYPDTTKSFYHSWMFTLFEQEFVPMAIEFDPNHLVPNEGYMTLSDFFQGLHHSRDLALAHAASQKIAFSCLNPTSSSFQKPITGTLQPCDWLPPPNRDTGMPHYLWDIAQKTTVLAVSLDPSPTYTCISHTWGRFRVPNSWVSMQGVPWRVPLNKRFKVVDLPDIFAQQCWQTPYLWFDLFCIPQDVSQLANAEIARQADIFRNSAASVAWLNDVVGWTSVSASLNWLALTYLDSTTVQGIYDTSALVKKFATMSDTNVELFPPPDSQPCSGVSSGFNETTYSSWFSSLWTLQEAFLCPSFALYSKNWEPLVDESDESGSLITLDTLFRLEENARRHCVYATLPGPSFSEPIGYEFSRSMHIAMREKSTQRTMKSPLGPRQISKLANETKLTVLWDASPISVLILGNLRECLESRAQAIMSVLGVTDWFTRHLGQENHNFEADLVLGMYPIEFIRELHAKSGASFFAIMKSTPPRFQLFRALLVRRRLGTMLPFATRDFRSSVTDMESSLRNMEDHPDVSPWLIQLGGSVEMRSVGVVASSQNTTRGDTLSWIMATTGQKSTFIHGQLAEILRRWSKAYTWYAIALCRNNEMLSGLILKTPRLRLQSTSYLVKVGYFRTLVKDFPSSQKIDWLVL